MTDIVVFGFGCLVTSMCAAAIVTLLQAARQDGIKDELRRRPVTQIPQPAGRAAERAAT